jgi:transcription termination/antitermination protein NusG
MCTRHKHNHTTTAANNVWYGIRTKSNFERTAALSLEGKGFETFLPTYRAHHGRAKRTTSIERVLFPGYVFCLFDATTLLPIVSTPGVVSIVGFGNGPAPIDNSELESIRNTLVAGIAVDPCDYLKEGQRVRIKRGPLQNVEGFLLRRRTEWRVVISVTLLQRSVSLEVERDWIETV